MNKYEIEELADLTDEQMEEFFLQYESGKKLKDILKHFKIKIHKLLKAKIKSIKTKDLCRHCSTPLYRKLQRKTVSSVNHPYMQCMNCMHAEFDVGPLGDTKKCLCEKCISADKGYIPFEKGRKVAKSKFTCYLRAETIEAIKAHAKLHQCSESFVADTQLAPLVELALELGLTNRGEGGPRKTNLAER